MEQPQVRPTQRPHKSSTHPEEFFHITGDFVTWKGKHVSVITLFFRKENDGKWRVGRALCDERDMFSRQLGRTLARRHYFQGSRVPVKVAGERPTFAEANAVVSDWCNEGDGGILPSMKEEGEIRGTEF